MAATTAGQQQQQQQKQGGPQQQGGGAQTNKRPSRWTGSHSFGSNSNSSNSNTVTNNINNAQNNARAQSPLNPANKANPGGSQANNANHAAINAPFTNIVATPEDLSKMHDRMLFLFANLVGHKVRCTLRTGIVYTAILSAVNDADLSVCLKLARQVEPPLVAAESASNGSTANGATPALPAPKASLVVAARDVIEIYAENVSLDAATVSNTSTSASRPTSPNANANASAKHSIMAALNNDTFRTDTDISGTGTSREQRELLRWGAGDSSSGGGLEDGGLEGPSSSGRGGKGGAWDQFAVNEKLFGTSTDYREEIYTTRLDKSGADYKAREARAAKLAEEIQSGVATNSHVAEERGGPGAIVDDSGLDEEDKYSGVQRSQNAYIPPGARRGLGQGPAAVDGVKTNGNLAQALRSSPAPATPATDVKARDSTAKQSGVPATPSGAQPVPVVTPASNPSQGKEDLVGDFKKFVSNEKEKLVQKRSQLEKQNKDKKMAELKQFSANFVLKMPVPADLVPILAKDEGKQKEIANRKPNAPGVASAIATATSSGAAKPASTHTSPNPQMATLKGTPTPSVHLPPRLGGVPATVPAAEKKTAQWALPSIPPFDPQKAAAARAAKAAAAAASSSGGSNEAAKLALPPTVSKFNAAAPAFVFRPSAGTFVPGGAASAVGPPSTPSPAPIATPTAPSLVKKPSDTPATYAQSTPPPPPQPLNPFFGNRIIRNNNNAPFRVKEDFSPFKRNEKIPDPSTIQPAWGFTGPSYKAAATSSYSFPSTSAAARLASPQVSHALHPHLQQASNGRAMHGSASQPLSSQASHLSRTSSAQGTSTLGSTVVTSGSSDDGGLGKSGHPTPIPSSSASAAGTPGPANGQPGPQQATAQAHNQGLHPMSGQSHIMPQGFVFQPQAGQQYPTFRYPQAGPQQVGAHQAQQMSHQQLHQLQQQMQGQPATHIVMGPNGQQMAYTAHGQFVQMPFSPSIHPAGQHMISPQMANQMAGGQPFMQPMFMAQQASQRGQNPQHPQHVFYSPMQASPGMHQQFVPMPHQQGVPMAQQQQQPQQMYDQSG